MIFGNFIGNNECTMVLLCKNVIKLKLQCNNVKERALPDGVSFSTWTYKFLSHKSFHSLQR